METENSTALAAAEAGGGAQPEQAGAAGLPAGGYGAAGDPTAPAAAQGPGAGLAGQAPDAPPGTAPRRDPLAEFRLERQLARGRALLEKELRVIESLDPAVKTVADLRAAPEFERFDRLVKEGLAISDAYKLACFDRLGRQQAAAARQAAINAARSKAHLAPVGGGEDPQDGLTDEIIQNYRQYNPRWTREQIAAFHRSYKQGV